MDQKLLFSGAVFMQIMKQLSVIDSFKGNWKALNTEENNSLTRIIHEKFAKLGVKC